MPLHGSPWHGLQSLIRSAALPCVALTGVLIAAGAGSATLEARADAGYRGRLLAEVLEELKSAGLALFYSTAVVKPDLRVTVEPSASEPRAILDQILTPLGLEAKEGPAGSLLILASNRDAHSIGGRVRSAARGVPVADAIVSIPELDGPVVTGPDGSFQLEALPSGSWELHVEAEGFLPATVTGVRVPSDGSGHLTIWLREQPDFVTELVVTPSQHSVVEQEVASRRSLGSEETVLIPSFGGDISRVVGYLPGVTADDNSAALHIRGSESGEVSFVLDGLELYDPFHLQTFQSPFTLIDSNIVDRVDFSAGGFTADFGDRLGARLDIQTLLPERSQKGEIELGTLNSRFSARGPLPGSAGSWLIAGRGWYPEVFYDNIELGGGDRVDPRMGDLYTKLSFNASPRAVISLHALGVYDFLDWTERPEEPGEAVESAHANTRNAYVWVSFLTAQTADITSATVVSYGSIDRQRNGLSAPEDVTSEVDDHRTVSFIGFRHETAWRLGEANVIRAGLDGRELRARYSYENQFVGLPSSAERIRLNPDGRSIGVFAAHRARLAPGFTTELGLRWDRQDYTDDNQLSPRFNAVWAPGSETELRMSVGRYYQSQRIHELEIEDGESRFRRAEESYQTEMSFQQGLPGGLRIRLDAYDKLMTRLNPRYENLWKHIELYPETSTDRVRIAPDRARLRGVEILLQGNAARPFMWWASYALTSAEDEFGSEEIPRSWDQTHAGKFLVGYRFRERWTISLTGTAHTGWPVTPVSATATVDPNGTVQIIETIEERNSDRYPTYIRFDAKARYSIDFRGSRLSLTGEVINLADRDNPCCVDEFKFDPQPNGDVDVDLVYDDWRTLTPSFSLLWEF